MLGKAKDRSLPLDHCPESPDGHACVYGMVTPYSVLAPRMDVEQISTQSCAFVSKWTYGEREVKGSKEWEERRMNGNREKE